MIEWYDGFNIGIRPDQNRLVLIGRVFYPISFPILFGMNSNDFDEFRRAWLDFAIPEDEEGVLAVIQKGVKPGLIHAKANFKIKQSRPAESLSWITNSHSRDISRPPLHDLDVILGVSSL